MTHIELFGPPGAGKSAIVSELTDRDKYYGGRNETAARRILDEKLDFTQKIIYGIIPEVIKSKIERSLIEYRLADLALEDFIKSCPEYSKVLSQAVDGVKYEPEKVFSLGVRAAKDYQMGISTVKVDEILCIDEGFVQRAFSVLWRKSSEKFSLKEYFQNVPTPELLVHIDASAGTCLDRQRQRGRMHILKDWETDNPLTIQKRLRDICFEINKQVPNDIPVITIENSGSIDEAIKEIDDKISQYHSM